MQIVNKIVIVLSIISGVFLIFYGVMCDIVYENFALAFILALFGLIITGKIFIKKTFYDFLILLLSIVFFFFVIFEFSFNVKAEIMRLTGNATTKGDAKDFLHVLGAISSFASVFLLDIFLFFILVKKWISKLEK